jgi:hypothetical protein
VPALEPGEMDGHREVDAAGPELVVRWVAAGAADCATALPGSEVVVVDTQDARRFTVALHGAAVALLSLAYPTDIAEALAPLRFYVRFANLAPSLEPVSVKQVTCATPFGAFENAGYGVLAMSPNDMADYFSAAVTIGETSFTTTPVVCDGTTEILRGPEYEFLGGTSVSFFVFEDEESRLRLTDCPDDSTARCVPLLLNE